MMARAAHEEDGLYKMLAESRAESRPSRENKLTIPVSAVRCCDWKKTASFA